MDSRVAVMSPIQLSRKVTRPPPPSALGGKHLHTAQSLKPLLSHYKQAGISPKPASQSDGSFHILLPTPTAGLGLGGWDIDPRRWGRGGAKLEEGGGGLVLLGEEREFLR